MRYIPITDKTIEKLKKAQKGKTKLGVRFNKASQKERFSRNKINGFSNEELLECLQVLENLYFSKRKNAGGLVKVGASTSVMSGFSISGYGFTCSFACFFTCFIPFAKK